MQLYVNKYLFKCLLIYAFYACQFVFVSFFIYSAAFYGNHRITFYVYGNSPIKFSFNSPFFFNSPAFQTAFLGKQDF